jgi:hypothetical protein
MKILLNILTILPLISLLYSGQTISQSSFQNDAILKIEVVKRSGSSKKAYPSGNGFLISKEGQFLTSYKLVKLAIRSPFRYRLKVTNNLGDELFNIKSAGCGDRKKVDLCLFRANYTIIAPFLLDSESLIKNEEVSSTSLLKNKSVSNNQGSFLNYELFENIEHIKSTIPYTDKFLGSPILNKKKKVVAMISYTFDSNDFDSINLFLSAKSILKFIENKQEFHSLEPMKERSRKTKKRQSPSARDLTTFINQKSKQLDKILKSMQGSQKNKTKDFFLKKKKLELVEGKVKKVKELMKEKEVIKLKSKVALKELISLQSSMKKIENQEKDITDANDNIDKEIRRLKILNRETTLKKIKNKKRIKSLKSKAEKKVLMNLSTLILENIQLTDDKIKKLKEKRHSQEKAQVKKLIEIRQRKKIVSDTIEKKNLLLESYQGSMEGLDAQAFDYFGDAI